MTNFKLKPEYRVEKSSVGYGAPSEALAPLEARVPKETGSAEPTKLVATFTDITFAYGNSRQMFEVATHMVEDEITGVTDPYIEAWLLESQLFERG